MGLGLGLKSDNKYNKNNNSNQVLVNRATTNATIAMWDDNLCQQYLDECKSNISKGLVPSSSLNDCNQILESHKCDMSKIK